jgi:hypothetical protein
MNEMQVTKNNEISLRLNDSLFSKELAPHYMKLAGQLASSELIPKSFRGKPQDLFICWAMGYSIGLSPEQSMQCIAVVNGRACMWGDEMLALCMAHKDFEDIEEHPIRTKDDTVIGYVCTVHRKGRKPKTSEFTLEMAKRAGLLGKTGPWTQYPERMLKLRARGFSLRDAFPDALKGIKSREEVEDYIDGEFTTHQNDSVSRTELLKMDMLLKKGANNDETTLNTNNMATEIADCAVKKVTDNDEIDSSMGESGAQEVEASDSVDVVPADDIVALHAIICKLIQDTGFSADRLSKAMKFYEVDDICDLPEDLARHFIAQLEKEFK